MEKEKIVVLIDGKTEGVWNGTAKSCGKAGSPGCGEEIGFARLKTGRWMAFNVDEFTSHLSTCTAKNGEGDGE